MAFNINIIPFIFNIMKGIFMKVLHIGKKGNPERFSKADSLIKKAEIIDMPNGLSADEYLSKGFECEHIIADAIAEVPASLINAMPFLKSIHSEGVAYNKIDLNAAKKNNVVVCHSVAMNASAVAEQTILLMDGLIKNILVNDRAVRSGNQITAKEAYMQNGNLYELSDCIVGLVGFGNIARAVTRLLTAYGVEHIYYYKRNRLSNEEEKQLGVEYKSLSELLGLSDIVSLHLPVTPASEKIANKGFFSQMKEGSYFVNTARGELVDDNALASALISGHIKMAGLDTMNNEPVSKDNYLLTIPDIKDQILLSPHIGGITASSFRRSYAMIWEDIETVRKGELPKRAVNL